jgi:hypothetical protein
MATTTNFGWETPDDTDLVKDGALAIRTLGSAIDTSLVDLKGGTTGQVLSKTSNTDMDFTWVTSDDANAIQNAIVDAKGDLIAASAADTPARLAVGNNGETLVADSSTSTGLRWQGNYAAGKNKIINGDYAIWQRGTSFSLSAQEEYTADRFKVGTGTGGAATITRESFTVGTAPVAGYESAFFLNINQTTSGTSASDHHSQYIEDVRTFAGQTITVSIWAKVSTGTHSITPQAVQRFGSGGSSAVVTAGSAWTLTTTWTRFTTTIAVPSISGKTIGSGSSLQIRLAAGTTGTKQFSYWGFQVESGSVASEFQTATGTLAGELSACMRYYQRINSADALYAQMSVFSPAGSTTKIDFAVQPFVPMRVTPTSLEYSTLTISDNAALTAATGTFALTTSNSRFGINFSYTHGTAVFTQYRNYCILANNSLTAYLGFSAEL